MIKKKLTLILFLLLIPLLANGQWFEGGTKIDTNRIAFIDKENEFTQRNYFTVGVFDTIYVHYIDSLQSAYWFNAEGDTIAYIDVAREKIAFFTTLQFGSAWGKTLINSDTVRAPKFITDTIGSNSPLNILSDTLNANGIYAVWKGKPATEISSTTINCNLNNNFYKTCSADTTFSITNLADGQTINVFITTTSTYTISWQVESGLTLRWQGGVAPTQTPGAKTDIYSFLRIGNIIYGSQIQNFY